MSNTRRDKAQATGRRVPAVQAPVWARMWAWAALSTTLWLSACGGGSGDNATSPLQNESPSYVNMVPTSRQEAARFLTQATFGPNEAAVNELMAQSFGQWIDDQMSRPPARTHLGYWDMRDAVVKQANVNNAPGAVDVNHGFWAQAISGPDQLRQRVAFALSEIFVVSYADSCGNDHSKGLASYLDMLGSHAFGSYRTLLEQVARHPVMACYLSHLKNQREDAKTGRVPDENFAREVMQLFSIGLYQLNPDGTQQRNAQGQPIETYTAADISGLAKVFTGLSFDCPDWPSDSCFKYGSSNGSSTANIWNRPLVGYPQYHSFASDKVFPLGRVPAQTRPDPEASLKEALDALALRHPNVGPFIGKQLIQRLVSSNPSPAYVARVTQAFESSGRNMGAMVKAILLDPEARDMAALQSDTFGKLREPVLRLTALLRAFDATSDTGAYIIDPTDDPANALAQSPLKSPSVFNFFRPGYVPPRPETAPALVAPEMQLVHESSTAAYVNYMRDVISRGAGRQGFDYKASRRDVQMEFALNANSPVLKLAAAADAGPLVDLIDQRLMYGTMPAELRQEIEAAVESITFKKPATPTTAEINNRLWSALLLTVASPEYQLQK